MKNGWSLVFGSNRNSFESNPVKPDDLRIVSNHFPYAAGSKVSVLSMRFSVTM